MADLGAIGVTVRKPTRNYTGAPGGIACVQSGILTFWAGAGRDDTIGNPGAPSLKHTNYGQTSFLWPVSTGARALSLDCKHNYISGVPDRPYFRIMASPELGLFNDVIIRASDTTAWQTLSSGSFTVSGTGALKVFLMSPYTGPGTQVNWDNIIPS